MAEEKTKTITETEKIAKKMYLIILVPFVIFIILATSILIYKSTVVKDDTVVATVNGYEITAQELSAAMSRNKSNVISYYKTKYDCDVGQDFWDKKFDGKTPTQYLRNYSLKKLTEYKVEQQIAVKYGLLKKSETTYKFLLEDMQRQNNDRSRKIANGQAVYGIQQYNATTYFNYVYSNLQLDLQEKLGEEGNPLDFSDKVLKDWYNSVKAEKYPCEDTYVFKGYYIPYETEETSTTVTSTDSENSKTAYTQEMAISVMEQVKQQLETGASKKTISSLCSDVKLQNIKLNEKNSSSMQKYSTTFYTVASNLQTGEISEVVCDNNSCMVFKCVSRKDGGYKDFKTYKDSIKTECVSDKYEGYIDSLVKSAKVVKESKYDIVD